MRHPRCLSKYVSLVFIFLLLSSVLVACNLPLALPGTGEGGDEGESSDGGDNGKGQEIPGDDSSDSDSSEGDAEDSDIMPVSGVCPLEDTRGVLEFNHNIEWGLDGVGKFKVEVQGSQLINVIRSIVTHEPDDKVGVHNVDQKVIPVTLSAIEFKDCTNGSGKTNMRVYVTGTCIDGVLTLYIQEYYEASSVTMICGDDDKVEIPLPIGAMEQPVKWSLSIIDAYQGMPSYPVPFLGMGGSGARVYTLNLSYIP